VNQQGKQDEGTERGEDLGRSVRRKSVAETGAAWPRTPKSRTDFETEASKEIEEALAAEAVTAECRRLHALVREVRA